MSAPSHIADRLTHPPRGAGKPPAKHTPPRGGNSALQGAARAPTALADARRAKDMRALQAQYPGTAVRRCPVAADPHAHPRHTPHRWSDFPTRFDTETGRWRRGRPTDSEPRGAYWLCPGPAQTAPGRFHISAPRDPDSYRCEPRPRTCQHCGADFLGHPAALYCTPEHRHAAANARRRHAKTPACRTVQCRAAECSVTFTQTNPRQLYHSRRCLERMRYLRRLARRAYQQQQEQA